RTTGSKGAIRKSAEPDTMEITNVFAAPPPASGQQASAGERQTKATEAGGRDQATARPANKLNEHAGAKPEVKPDAKQVDHAQCEASADAIDKACNQGGLFGAGTDKETIYAVLKDKTEAERQEIDRIFNEKYGKKIAEDKGVAEWGLKEEFEDELSGADLDKAMNLLNRKDGSADRAGRIHAALVERGQWIEGRTDATCEKDIRDTLA